MDAIAQFKENAKRGWSTFAPTEVLTGLAAPRLVRFAGIEAGMHVLDVACGTGVVALTAARLGAQVTGADLTPALVARARENSAIAHAEVEWIEADAEALPLPDAKFDVVVSQFGHMFAPQPALAVKEMLRVLKPGGTVAFSTWPPELLTGGTFNLIGKYAPAPPPGISPPAQWGEPSVIRERLGAAVKNIQFDRDSMRSPALSPQHFRLFLEANVGPISRLVQSLSGTDEAKLSALRRELEELAMPYFENNYVRQDFLLTRATKL